jgi:hypothetical protein
MICNANSFGILYIQELPNSVQFPKSTLFCSCIASDLSCWYTSNLFMNVLVTVDIMSFQQATYRSYFEKIDHALHLKFCITPVYRAHQTTNTHNLIYQNYTHNNHPTSQRRTVQITKHNNNKNTWNEFESVHIIIPKFKCEEGCQGTFTIQRRRQLLMWNIVS